MNMNIEKYIVLGLLQVMLIIECNEAFVIGRSDKIANETKSENKSIIIDDKNVKIFKKKSAEKILSKPMNFVFTNNHDLKVAATSKNGAENDDDYVDESEIKSENNLQKINANDTSIQDDDKALAKDSDIITEKHAKGAGKEHKSEHHSQYGEKGDKGYKEYHANLKNQKGHHDKENHSGHYEDKGGKVKKAHDEFAHYGEHSSGEEGSKEVKYGESGKYSKGHDTKGSHDIHKKDEYEKKIEFFEEEHSDGDEEKQGAYYHEHDSRKGGKSKGSHLVFEHHHDGKGKKGFFEKGAHDNDRKGHVKEGGHDMHHSYYSDYGQKSGKVGAKKWGFRHGDGKYNLKDELNADDEDKNYQEDVEYDSEEIVNK